MKDITGSLKFVVFFLVMTLIVAMMFGQKIAMWFLTLILLGMVITNPDKVTAFIDQFSTPDLNATTPQTTSSILDAGGGIRV